MTDRRNGIIGWIVTMGDAILACFLLYVYFKLFQAYVPSGIAYGLHSSMVIMIISVLITAFVFPSVIDRRKMVIEQVVKRNALASFMQVLLFSTICRLMTHTGNFVIFTVTYGVMLFVVVLLARLFERIVLNQVRSWGHNTRSVLFVGSDPALMIVYRELLSSPSTGYRMIGYYSDDEIEDAPDVLPKLGSKSELREIMTGVKKKELYVDEIYCCLSKSEGEVLKEIMDYCDSNVVHFFYVPRIFGTMQMSLSPELFGRMVIFTNHPEPLHDTTNRIMKRAFDIIFSIVILLFMLPFVPIIALIIKCQSPGPVFFKQERTGLNGASFVCYKFRSMHINANADKIQAKKDDPRKFAFGNFMRKTNLDEFPQFFNVLKGDMSIVGPRPHMVYHTEKYSALINKYMVRHFSKPGITGYAQVTGFRGETEHLWQMEGRIQKDIWYIENWSLWLDIKIIFLTAWSIVYPDKAAY